MKNWRQCGQKLQYRVSFHFLDFCRGHWHYGMCHRMFSLIHLKKYICNITGGLYFDINQETFAITVLQQERLISVSSYIFVSSSLSYFSLDHFRSKIQKCTSSYLCTFIKHKQNIIENYKNTNMTFYLKTKLAISGHNHSETLPLTLC